MLILSLFHLIYVLSITAVRLCFCCPFFHCLKPCKLIFSAEVNFESTYWERQVKKAISQIILCSFYLKVKAVIYNLAAPGWPPIPKPAIIFPSKKFLCISAIKIFHRDKYSLLGFGLEEISFWHRQALMAPTGCPGASPCTWPRRPLMLSPGQAVGVLPQPGSPALAGISWVHPDLLPALPFPWGSGPLAGPISGSTSLRWPGPVAL